MSRLGQLRFWGLPQRIKTLLKDAESIRRLMRVLVEQDAIGLYLLFQNVTNDCKEYSMFEYPDEETTKQINVVSKLCREAIYEVQKDLPPSQGEEQQRGEAGSQLETGEEDERYKVFEDKNKEIKGHKLLRGYSLVLKFDYSRKLQELKKIIDALPKTRILVIITPDVVVPALSGKRPSVPEPQAKRTKPDPDESDPETFAPTPAQASTPTVLIICEDEKEKSEIRNFLLAKIANPSGRDMGFAVKLKRFLGLHSDLAKRKGILEERNFGKFPPDLVREAALVEAKLAEVTDEINEYYEWVYMGIQQKRERKEMELGHELFDLPCIRCYDHHHHGLDAGVTETEYMETDMQSNYNSLGVVPGANVLVKLAESPTEYSCLLDKYSPAAVVLYRASVGAVRALEDFCATRRQSLEVFQLYYQNTVEDYQFFSYVGKEKTAFEALRQEAMGSDKEGKEVKKEQHESQPQGPCPVVAVDVREFAGPLPAYLYTGGIKVVPLMLSVGDYVISNDICIERKAVGTGDLFESIRCGRLYAGVSV